MNELLDSIGSALWRASWQGAVLAILVGLVIGGLGNRLTPKWRYLLWGVVVARLLLVMAPQSSWSLFNLASAERGEVAAAVDEPPRVAVTAESMPSYETSIEASGNTLVPDSSPGSASAAGSSPVESVASSETGISVTKTREARDSATLSFAQRAGWSLRRWAAWIWLAGCTVLAVCLAGASLALRRRLLACRPVTDASLLEMFDLICRTVGVRRQPVLLVTPETISPFVVGAFQPRIVVPESLLTGRSRGGLRQVLAHELAHVKRGDLGANWFLLAARVLHWFNPAAWWAVRSMQAEREAACDQIALDALGETERSHYAETIMELASSLVQPPMAPGMIGLFSSRSTLKSRVKRILCPSTSPPIPATLVAGMLLLLALVGLTDAMPEKAADDGPANPVAISGAQKASAVKDDQQATRDFSIRGVCRDADDDTVLPGIHVRLMATRGLVGAVECVAETTTGNDGRFEFSGLEAPRPENELDRLDYGLLATAENRPAVFLGDYGLLGELDGREMTLPIGLETTTLTGRVLDQQGRPVVGATVARYVLQRRPVTGAGSAVTDNNGNFSIADLDAKGNRISFHSDREGKTQIRTVPSHDERLRKLSHVQFHVFHTDYPIFRTAGLAMRPKLNFVLPIGCTLSGKVTDSTTGQPAPGVTVTAQNMNAGEHAHALTDNRGRYRLAVARGNYNILARTEGRVCVAIPDRECPAGETIELPPLALIRGGLIAGQVFNTSTGKPEVWTESGQRVALGFYRPSLPGRKIFGAIRLALVDDEGRFVLRAAPGKNYPYLVNARGSRMSWDTRKQDPVIVVEGETVDTKILVAPPPSAEEKMAAAGKILNSLPKTTSERVEGILQEFRKLNHTVDETEIWCLLMKDLVTIGSDAVPQLCAELDATTEQRMMRRLGFALRAIGDARAVPALIRAIPRTLQPSMSGYGLKVEDAGLMAFMQEHDLDAENGRHFVFALPVVEIFAALQTLTKQNFTDEPLYSVRLSDDPPRQRRQRHLCYQQARRWQAWWEAHWREFTDDESFAFVNLPAEAETPFVSISSSGPTPRIADGGGFLGMVLSPAAVEGRYVDHFLDLDTGLEPTWPKGIARNENAFESQELGRWAAKNGVDLMCAVYRSGDGKATCVLRAFDMKVWEIDLWDAENIKKRLAAGKIPDGRPVDDLLMHYDAASGAYAPDANAAFIYQTREGAMGMIHVTDRVTRTANLTGLPVMDPLDQGVGFHKGVRFNHKPIVR